jgi:ABC-2 type transport system ATP-binding protein
MAIQVEELSKHYGSVRAVDRIHFRVERGTTCALLGGNGAGKTTTIAMLLGLLLPSAGHIRILGEDMLRHRYRVLPRMNFSSPYLDLPQRLTVAENLTVYARLYGVSRVREQLSNIGRDLDIERFFKRPYRSLSAGQKTRVALAKALLNEPEVLLLDEPTASLDPDTADRIRTLLKDYQVRSGATVLMASHNMSEVERLCDQVIMLRAGRIVDTGAPRELIQRYGRQDMEEVFLDIARGHQGGEVMI